jgi:AcrR family transcriptional regulator
VPVVKSRGERLSRRQRGERTRARIVDTALRLFSEQGYEATTMQQIADAAEVAVQTVYLWFRTKPQLLSQVEARVIVGVEPQERWREQPWAKALYEERDPRRLLEIFVEVSTGILERITSFVAAFGPGLPTDPATTAERDRGRDDYFRALIDRLSALRALRSGLTATRALDILRAVHTVDAYRDLTRNRGWTAEEWSAWMLDLLTYQLLGVGSERR